MSDIAEQFAKETAEHTLEIRHDDGLYRQIRFTASGSLNWFDLITWPYNLVVNGSHGSYHFCASATKDMFTLIHESRMDGAINHSYWAEKVRAGQTKSWSEPKFRQWLTQRAVNLELHHPGTIDAVASQILDSDEHSLEYEETARHAVASFRHEGDRLSFPEAWEYDFTDYDHHYLWMCHAAAWGVTQYDAAKASKDGPARRLDVLRAAVVQKGGDWTTRRAVDLLGGEVTTYRARTLPNDLANEGLLAKHGKRGRLWTPAVHEAVASNA